MIIKSINKQNKQLSLTLYKNGVALINEIREIFKSKTNCTVEYHNISNYLDEASFLISDITSSEVDFNYLASNNNLQIASNNLSCNNKINKSTFATIKNLPPNTDEIGVYYLSKEILWECCYNIFLQDNSTLQLDTWFNVTNNSGNSYINANLKFITGDVNTPRKYTSENNISSLNLSTKELSDLDNLDDYHLFLLPGKYSLLNNTTKRIKNSSINNIKYSKYYDFSYYNNKAKIIIEILNSKKNNLGIVFSAGVSYVYSNINNNLEFIGGDNIKNSIIDDTLLFNIGTAINISCSRKIVSSKIINDYEVKEIEFVINNKQDTIIDFSICHPIFASFEMESSSEEYTLNKDGNPCFKNNCSANEYKKINFIYKIKL